MSRREPEHETTEFADLTKPRADFNESPAEYEKHFNQWSIKMKSYTMTGILISTERRKCSIYGNPAWNLTIEYDGEYITGKTASNAQCGYSVSNHKIGDQITIKGHFTRAGNLIIDSIKD